MSPLPMYVASLPQPDAKNFQNFDSQLTPCTTKASKIRSGTSMCFEKTACVEC